MMNAHVDPEVKTERAQHPVAVTRADIDGALAMHRRSKVFPPVIEAGYADHIRNYRIRLARSIMPPTIIIYNLFLIVDWLLLPHTFLLAAVLHLVLVTPLIVLTTVLVTRTASNLRRDIVVAVPAVAMVGQIVLVYALNSDTAADHYQYLAVMIVVFMNIVYKMDYRHSVIATGVLGAIYLSALSVYHHDLDSLIIGTTLFASAAFMTLEANHRRGRDARYAYLHKLKDNLLREEAEIESSRDPLTGLFNRRRLDAKAQEIWAAGPAAPSSVAVVVLDIDHFKTFNDRYGHLAGDLCLKRIAGAISEASAQKAGLPVRFGGEEFLVLLPDADIADAMRLAEQLRCMVEDLAIPHEAIGATCRVTASFGVTAGPPSAYSLEELVRAADKALYAAKRAGRNRVWPPFPGQVTRSETCDRMSRRADALANDR